MIYFLAHPVNAIYAAMQHIDFNDQAEFATLIQTPCKNSQYVKSRLLCPPGTQIPGGQP